MAEARLIFSKLKANYESTHDELKLMLEEFMSLYGYHSRSHFNTTLTALCSTNRQFRQAVVTVVCKTSALSREDGKVGLKDQGIQERMLDYLHKNMGDTTENEDIYRRLYDDLLNFTDWGSLAQSSVEMGSGSGEDLNDDHSTKNGDLKKGINDVHSSDQYGNDGDTEGYVFQSQAARKDRVEGNLKSTVGSQKEASQLERVGGKRNMGKESSTNYTDKSTASNIDTTVERISQDVQKLEAKYGNVRELELKVKMQEEAISMMEASLRNDEDEGMGGIDSPNVGVGVTEENADNPLETSNASDAYEDDFENSQQSPLKETGREAPRAQSRGGEMVMT